MRIKHGTRQLYVLFENVGKEQIDETHPRWDEIMAHFYHKSFANVEAFFQDKAKQDHWVKEAINDAKNHEEGQTITSHHLSSSFSLQSAQHGNSEPVQQQADVEDMTKSSSNKWMMIAVVVFLVAVLLVIMR